MSFFVIEVLDDITNEWLKFAVHISLQDAVKDAKFRLIRLRNVSPNRIEISEWTGNKRFIKNVKL